MNQQSSDTRAGLERDPSSLTERQPQTLSSSGDAIPGWDLETQAVRSGTHRTPWGEHSDAMFLTSSFVFDSAASAAARFSGTEPGLVYSRFTNPTVDAFAERLAVLEGGEAGLATATGMAAIVTLCMGVLKAGDEVVASQSLFGSTVQWFSQILARFGVHTHFVPLSNLDAWRAACTPKTRMFFIETPSNPLTEIGDIAALAEIAHAHGALLAVDNCFCTPALQRPLTLGADVVTHSATKFLDGQGRVLGGALVGSKAMILEQCLPVLRTAGPSLSPFNAWVLHKGLETLALRMERQSQTALSLAHWLQEQPQVLRVHHPGLSSHPQHALAMRQQSAGGAVLSFEIRGERPAAWALIDASRVFSITGNLGDVRSTITHPASTTHGRLKPEQRAQAGVSEGLVRISVGLESLRDLQEDLLRGLRGAAS